MAEKTILTEKKNTLWFWAALMVIAVLGGFLFFYATPDGLALVNDSVGYINGAQNLAAGQGYLRNSGGDELKPITNFPPLYSLALSAVLRSGLEPFAAAWWLAFGLYLANLFLVGLLGRQITGSAGFGAAGSVLFLLLEPFFRFQLAAMSEPLFFFTHFTALLAAGRYFQTRKMGWVVLAGVLASLSYLTRYIGAALLLTLGLAVLIFARGWRQRLRAAAWFVIGALPALAAWTLRNIQSTGSAANRQMEFHSIPAAKIQEGIITFWGWLLPDRLRLVERAYPLLVGGLVLAGLALIGWGLWLAWQGFRNAPEMGKAQPTALWMQILYPLVYVAVLTVTLMFLDASVNYEARILTPPFFSVVLLGIAAAAALWRRGVLLARLAAVGGVLLVLLVFATDLRETVNEFQRGGQGFADPAWTERESIQMLREMPAGQTIYTNRPQAVLLLVGRGAYFLPTPTNPATGQPRENYAADLEKIRLAVNEGKVVVAIFDVPALRENSQEAQWVEDVSAGVEQVTPVGDDLLLGRDS